MPHYIKVSQTASTNTYLSRLAATLPPAKRRAVAKRAIPGRARTVRT